MSELFGVLDVARRAMFVTQGGLRTTAHNIANVNTPGYSRQRQVLETAGPVPHPAGTKGTGVVQRSIQRITDDFLLRQLVSEQSASGSTQTQAQALARLEEIVNEQQAPGLGSALDAFYSTFSELASSTTPGAPVEREAVRAAATALVDTIHVADARMRAVQRDADRSIVATLGEINQLAGRIAGLNQQIISTETVAPANDLRDTRDELLRQLAEKVELSSFEREDGGLVVLLDGGLPLVDGGRAARLEAVGDATNPFDASFSRVFFDDGSNRLDLTDAIGGGTLGGFLRVRDSIGAAAIRSLDTVAYNLAVQVNGVHASGVGLDGTVGNFFQAPSAVEDAARGLALDPAVAARPEAIAAGLTTATGDNRNALALAELRGTPTALFLPGDPPGPASGPSRTLLDHLATIVADVGQQSRVLQDARGQQEQILQAIQNRREEVSGVSLDEEMTNLIRLQAAFQANARIVNAVNELMDDVLSLL